jgi:metal iron transporter
MNRPSRTDEPEGDGYNQSPNPLSNDLTTNQDLNGISNARMLRRQEDMSIQDSGQDPEGGPSSRADDDADDVGTSGQFDAVTNTASAIGSKSERGRSDQEEDCRQGSPQSDAAGGDRSSGTHSLSSRFKSFKHAIVTFGKFIGPGFMVAVAYSKE